MEKNEIFTDLRLTLFEKDHLRGFASVKVANAIWITGIKIVEGSKGMFISMPSHKDKRGEYMDVYFPTSKENRDTLQALILDKYNLANQKSVEVEVTEPEAVPA